MERRCIVVGLDGSASGQAAARWSADVARALDARVVAVHGLGTAPELLLGLSPTRLRHWRTELREALHLWCEPLQAADVEYCEILIDDEPVGALLRAALEERADLIVVGSQAVKGVLRWMLGSVSDKLLHRAIQPVVIVPESRTIEAPVARQELRDTEVDKRLFG